MRCSDNRKVMWILQQLCICLFIAALVAEDCVLSFGEGGTAGRDATAVPGHVDKAAFDLDFGDAPVRATQTQYAAVENDKGKADSRASGASKKIGDDKVWKSEDLDLLGIGMAIGDLDADGKKEIVVIDPSAVHVYKMTPERKLSHVCDYSAGSLELKSVDVAQARKQGPSRIYVSAQNRGSVSSFVLEYRNGALVPVISDIPYFLRVLEYPTRGPILLGQQKGLRKMYDGLILRMTDKGDDLEPQAPFGVPQKIPIFGFTIGDFEGKKKPLIAVYDREEHLRVYDPSGKRLFITQDYYGGSDVVLRAAGPETRSDPFKNGLENEKEFFRPRILSRDLKGDSIYEVLVITHSSKTRRLLSQTKMLEEGQVTCLEWNGDALAETWSTPKIQGMVTDFAIESLPGFSGAHLITLVRKKTDWLAFLNSKSQIRVYDLPSLMTGSVPKDRKEE
jgi:hypothetical protein